MCVIQIYQSIYDVSKALPMFFITLWGCLSIVFLCKKQKINTLSLFSILKNKLCFFIYTYSFNISLIISLLFFVVLLKNIENEMISTYWLSLKAYPVIVAIVISFLSTIHNMDIVYKSYVIRVYLNFITHVGLILGLIFCYVLFQIFWNVTLKGAYENKVYAFSILYALCFLSIIITNNIMVLFLSLIKFLSKYFK